MNDRECLMNKIQSYLFAEKDLNLYLDTHPRDTKAIEMHMAVAKKLKELIREYEEVFGPLTSCGNKNPDKWDWIESPWPWENK